MLIENKIYSTESKGQLKKNRNWIENEFPTFKYKIYIFLSLFEQEISEEEQDYYLRLDYTHIVKLIEQIIQTRNLANKSQFVFEQYLQTLKSMLNQNEEIEKIAESLYQKYQPAFDLVFKYAKPTADTIVGNNKLIELVKNEPKLQLISSERSYSYIKFHLKFLYDLLPSLKEKEFVSKDYNLTSDYVFQCEFNVRKDSIVFNMHIGEGNQETRQRIYEFYLGHQDFFDKVAKRKELSPKWHLIFSKQIISKAEFENSFEDEDFDIDRIIEKRFKDLVDNEFFKIEQIFRQELER